MFNQVEELTRSLGLPPIGKHGFSLIAATVVLLFILYCTVELLTAIRAHKRQKRPQEETVLMEQMAELLQPDQDDDPEVEAHEFSLGRSVPYSWKRLPEAKMLRRSQDFYWLMNQRRTVRFFSSEAVPRKIIDNILRTAGTSPSGAHQQPWTFVVISSVKIKKQLQRIVENEEEINYKRRMGQQWLSELEKLGTNWLKPYIVYAPYILLVFKQVYSLRADGSKQVHYYSEHSVSIAIGILLAAIHNAGLHSLTSTPLNCGTAISKLLDRPPNEKFVYLLPIGYPANDCTVPDMKRKDLEEIATYM